MIKNNAQVLLHEVQLKHFKVKKYFDIVDKDSRNWT